VEHEVGVGDPVQLKVAYTGSWSSGFDVADVVPGGFRIRRRSDGRILPGPTSPADVRPDSEAPPPR
jgi:hypothetical protein